MHVVATAGHVDHGKSTLVRALTGMEPDRLAEERRRGLTIDLGYAWATLPSGAQVAFVDVPGHERFIGTMLAGIGPAPAVVFVVAADGGWSRQSEEHLAAIDALQLRHGLLVVTRADLADGDTVAATLEEARVRLARSSLGDVAAVAVSAVTGAGLDGVVAGIDTLVAALPAPVTDAPVRLWLDRSFTVRGSGTVVTGTLSAGSVGAGDTLALLDGQQVTVREVQSTGRRSPRVSAVARVAVNLRGVPKSGVGRGDVVLTPDAWHVTSVVDVRLQASGSVPPAAEAMLHVGTAAVPVRLRPLDGSGGGGGSGSSDGAAHVRLTLARALPLRAGDRGVLRDPGRQVVAAGVLVLDADPPPLRRRGAAAARAGELARSAGRPDLAAEVARRGAVRRDHLARLGVPLDGADTVRGVGPWLVSPARWDEWRAAVPAHAADWAAANPLDPAIPLPALRRRLAAPSDDVVAALAREAGLRVADGRAGGTPAGEDRSLGPAEAAVRTLTERLAARPFAAPEAAELAELRLGHRELTAAARAGRLLRLDNDVVLLPDAPARARDLLATLPQPFTTSEARQALGSTRRVVIPLLEHLDATGATERVDTTRRRLRPG